MRVCVKISKIRFKINTGSISSHSAKVKEFLVRMSCVCKNCACTKKKKSFMHSKYIDDFLSLPGWKIFKSFQMRPWVTRCTRQKRAVYIESITIFSVTGNGQKQHSSLDGTVHLGTIIFYTVKARHITLINFKF